MDTHRARWNHLPLLFRFKSGGNVYYYDNNVFEPWGQLPERFAGCPASRMNVAGPDLSPKSIPNSPIPPISLSIFKFDRCVALASARYLDWSPSICSKLCVNICHYGKNIVERCGPGGQRFAGCIAGGTKVTGPIFAVHANQSKR